MTKAADFETTPVQSRLCAVNPSTAERWLSASLWDRQRPYRDWHGEELAETMRANEFIQGTQIHFAKLGDQNHLVNGQHTLNAIIKSGLVVSLSILTTRVKNEAEIADLYMREDTHLRRTVADAYCAHKLDEKYELSTAQINQLGAGIRCIIGEFNNSRGSMDYASRSSSKRIKEFAEYGEAGALYFKSIKGCPAAAMRSLRSGPVIGVALRTFRESPKKAAEFWSQVAFTDGVLVGDPRKTLSIWLQGVTTRVNPAVHSRIAAHAWNLFIADKKAKRFHTPDWTLPIQINKAS